MDDTQSLQQYARTASQSRRAGVLPARGPPRPLDVGTRPCPAASKERHEAIDLVALAGLRAWGAAIFPGGGKMSV